MPVINYTEPQRRALSEAVQPIFETAGDALAAAFAQAGLSTSARRLHGNEELTISSHGLIGAGVASMVMTVQAHDADPEDDSFLPPSAQDTFSSLACGIANVIVGARRLGVDLLPLISGAIPASAIVPIDEADAEVCLAQMNARVEGLYDVHSNLPDEFFAGDTIMESYDSAIGDEDDDGDEDEDEDEGDEDDA